MHIDARMLILCRFNISKSLDLNNENSTMEIFGVNVQIKEEDFHAFRPVEGLQAPVW